MPNNRGKDFLFSDDCGFINGEDGESYRYSDGSGYYHGADGSEGYIYSDGSGYYHGADGSDGYIYSDGSAYYRGADGTDAYKYSDGSGYYRGADGSDGYKYSDTLIVPMATGVHITLMMTMMMITVSGNSTFNNATPVGKASSNPGIITQSLKLKIMAEMMRQNNNIWDQKLAHIHQDEMFNILVSQKE